MCGDDARRVICSVICPEMRVRKDHPLRAEVPWWTKCSTSCRGGSTGSMPRLDVRRRAVARLQMLYSIRSERLLIEEMDYDLFVRWFVGLNARR